MSTLIVNNEYARSSANLSQSEIPGVFRYKHQKHIRTILLHSDTNIRRIWQTYFDSMKMPLSVYSTMEEFLGAIGPSGENVQFVFEGGAKSHIALLLAYCVKDWPNRISTSILSSTFVDYFKDALSSNVVDAVLSELSSEVFSVEWLNGFLNLERARICWLESLVSATQINRVPDGACCDS
jgi:hypothetical protein